MFRRSVLILALFCAASYYIGIAGYAEAASDPRCEGLSGAAYGLCLAAIATGCDDLATANPGCAKIEESFTRITGVTPTWTLTPCPCGTATEFIAHLEEQGGAASCKNVRGRVLSIDTMEYGSSIFSYYPGQGEEKQTCGYNGTSAYSMTDDEAKSCIIELETTLEKFGMMSCEML